MGNSPVGISEEYTSGMKIPKKFFHFLPVCYLKIHSCRPVSDTAVMLCSPCSNNAVFAIFVQLAVKLAGQCVMERAWKPGMSGFDSCDYALVYQENIVRGPTLGVGNQGVCELLLRICRNNNKLQQKLICFLLSPSAGDAILCKCQMEESPSAGLDSKQLSG